MNKRHIVNTMRCTGIILGLAVAVTLASCERAEPEREALPDVRQMQQLLDMTNKRLLAREEQAIDDFLLRYGLTMQETGTGLRYLIHEQGSGDEVSYGRFVEMDYEVFLLNGDLVYSSKDEGPLNFRVGRGGAVSGLDEGVRLLREGAKATFILPYHLAHGIPGDGSKIPGRATIVYHVHLTNMYH